MSDILVTVSSCILKGLHYFCICATDHALGYIFPPTKTCTATEARRATSLPESNYQAINCFRTSEIGLIVFGKTMDGVGIQEAFYRKSRPGG